MRDNDIILVLRCRFLRIYRFVEVTAVAIRDTNGKAKHRLIVEHRTGERETVVSSTEKQAALTVGCAR